MRKQIFTAIAEKLLSVPGITYVDLWNDNGSHFAGGAVYPLPAVFVEFETIEWHQQNNHARRADINVRLHVLNRASAGIHGSQDPAMEEALARFDLLDSVNSAMQGLRGDNFAGFMHTVSATNHAHDEILEDIECFRTSAQDTTQCATRGALPISLSRSGSATDTTTPPTAMFAAGGVLSEVVE